MPVFGDDVESSLGSNPLKACSSSPGENAWPADIDESGAVDIFDVVAFRHHYASSLGDPAYAPRFDLGFDGTIDISDIEIQSDFYALTCSEWADSDGDTIVDADDTDDDDDGFEDVIELYLATDYLSACSVDSSHDAWPPDFEDDRDVDIFDVLAVKPHFASPGHNPNYSSRHDLQGQDGDVDIFDLLAIKPFFGETCTQGW